MPRRRRKSVLCLNCQYRFDGIDNYCPNCGQENHSHHAPIKHLTLELIEGLTHFDTKFFNTTKALLTKPGQLTADYIVDRRARYVPPIRLYIFASFVFFLSLPLFSNSSSRHASIGSTTVQSSPPNSGNLKVQFFNETLIQDTFVHDLAGRTDLSDAVVDSLVEAKAPDRSWIIKLGLKQAIRQEIGLITKADLEHAFIKNSGIALFILMPIFALILKLFYIRRKRLYIDHLIFSLHLHGFAFVLLTITSLMFKLLNSEGLILLLLVAPIVYGPLALHRVYGGKLLGTFVKSTFIFTLYGVCLLAGLVATLVASFITL